jgi:hypothetical protein
MPRASHLARMPLEVFSRHVQALVRDDRLLPQAGSLLIDAATAAIGCVSGAGGEPGTGIR